MWAPSPGCLPLDIQGLQVLRAACRVPAWRFSTHEGHRAKRDSLFVTECVGSSGEVEQFLSPHNIRPRAARIHVLPAASDLAGNSYLKFGSIYRTTSELRAA